MVGVSFPVTTSGHRVTLEELLEVFGERVIGSQWMLENLDCAVNTEAAEELNRLSDQCARVASRRLAELAKAADGRRVSTAGGRSCCRQHVVGCRVGRRGLDLSNRGCLSGRDGDPKIGPAPGRGTNGPGLTSSEMTASRSTNEHKPFPVGRPG